VKPAVEVAVQPPYPVFVGPGCLDGVRSLADKYSQCAVLTEGRVAGLHRERLRGFGDEPWLQVPSGEEAKSLSVVEEVLDGMAEVGLDRGSLLVTFGGGSVSDVGGLAASLYGRGIAVAHAPTTLLAQVDAAIGGKTGVNLAGGKNLAGTFHQPRAVYADTDTLTTLEAEQVRSGLGEVVKCVLLGAEGLAQRLDVEAPALARPEGELASEVVTSCARLKAAVVEADEREAGARKQLNLGHTFGHAIELAAGYGKVPHGVAVGVGLVLALETSRRMGLLDEPQLPERVGRWLAALGLPETLGQLRSSYRVALPAGEVAQAMRLDKKGQRSEPRFVLPQALGVVVLDVEVEGKVLDEVLI
jgi:3-dehydroquinate synthase